MTNGMSRRVRVLVVDDSPLVCEALTAVLSSDPEIEVLGTADDPLAAMEQLRRQRPDVITLDLEMPWMDGLTFLQKLMAQNPVPVVVCSSLPNGREEHQQALAYGAVEVIQKPSFGAKQFLEKSRTRLCQAVKAAAKVRPIRRTGGRGAVAKT